MITKKFLLNVILVLLLLTIMINMLVKLRYMDFESKGYGLFLIFIVLLLIIHKYLHNKNGQ